MLSPSDLISRGIAIFSDSELRYIHQAGGPSFHVPTGRLDGKISVKEEALTLPSPAFPFEQSLESFVEKGLDAEDMVVLLGKEAYPPLPLFLL
jgi:hypothetical protein